MALFVAALSPGVPVWLERGTRGILGLVRCAICFPLFTDETTPGDESALDLIASFLLTLTITRSLVFFIFLSYLTTQADWFVFFYFYTS